MNKLLMIGLDGNLCNDVLEAYILAKNDGSTHCFRHNNLTFKIFTVGDEFKKMILFCGEEIVVSVPAEHIRDTDIVYMFAIAADSYEG